MLVLQLAGEFPGVAGDAPEIMVRRVLDDAYRIGRPAGIVQDAADLQRALRAPVRSHWPR
jgi:hypothetical protein